MSRHHRLDRQFSGLRATSPEILEPVARAFADAVRKTVERGERAFK
jgi:hypothetical protein